MGGYFQANREVKRITLPSNEKYWVEILTDLRYGEMKKYINVSEDGQVDFSTSADRYLLSIIHDWNLDNEAGEKAPIDQETIDLLTQADAIAIIEAAGGSAESDDSKKNSSAES